MRTRRSRTVSSMATYFSTAALLFPVGIWVGSWWPWFGIGLILVGVVNVAAGVIEIANKLRDERYEREEFYARLDLFSPVIEQEKQETEFLRELNAFSKLILKMDEAQLRTTSWLAPAFVDYVGKVDENDNRRYRDQDVGQVIFYWSEEKYHTVYLPSQHDKPSGSRLQMIIKAVTDDLLALGLATRDRSNSRAYLKVDREEAYKALVKGER